MKAAPSAPFLVPSLVGRTPLVSIPFAREGVTLRAKCEFMNPSGSIKDRFASAVVADAEGRGLLRPGMGLLECSSGNTGVALAMVGAARGYPVTIVISRHASEERRMLIRHYGADVIEFAGDDYWQGVELTRKMAAENPRWFLPRQFENELNPSDHEETTGREILEQTPGPIHAFVTGYGTGGTITGVARALRKRHPAVGIHIMEPAEAALLLGEASCTHGIEGVGDGFVPPLLRGLRHDGVIKIHTDEAVQMAKRLAVEHGLPVGPSSGANVCAALELARRLGPGASIVTLLCDRAERYFSTPLFAAAGPKCASGQRATV